MGQNQNWEDRSPRIDNYYHAFTKGSPSINLYETESDFVAGMNSIPILLERFGLELLISKLNDSHEHHVLHGTYLSCLCFIREHVRHAAQAIAFRRRKEGMALPKKYFPGLEVAVLPIETEQSLRNRIGYTAKNSYDNGLPIAPWYDPWSSACTIFAPYEELKIKGKRIGDLGNTLEQSRLLRTRHVYSPDWRVDERYLIHPVWYTDYDFVNQLFGTPERFVKTLVNRKNAEEEEAIRLATSAEKTVQELRVMASEESARLYGNADVELLGTYEKVQVCTALRQVGATFSQLQRVVRISASELRRLMR